MRRPADKITGSTFWVQSAEITWMESIDCDYDSDGNVTTTYPIWFLIQTSTERVIVTVDGPTEKQICYDVSDGNNRRRFISFDGAKAYALECAQAILDNELKESAERKSAKPDSKLKWWEVLRKRILK